MEINNAQIMEINPAQIMEIDPVETKIGWGQIFPYTRFLNEGVFTSRVFTTTIMPFIRGII